MGNKKKNKLPLGPIPPEFIRQKGNRSSSSSHRSTSSPSRAVSLAPLAQSEHLPSPMKVIDLNESPSISVSTGTSVAPSAMSGNSFSVPVAADPSSPLVSHKDHGSDCVAANLPSPSVVPVSVNSTDKGPEQISTNETATHDESTEEKTLPPIEI